MKKHTVLLAEFLNKKLDSFLRSIKTSNQNSLFLQDCGIPIVNIHHPEDNLEKLLSYDEKIRTLNFLAGKDNGILEKVSVARIALAQNTINPKTVLDYAKQKVIDPISLLEYRGFYFCANGTHRFFSRLLLGDSTISAKVYHCPIPLLVSEKELFDKRKELVEELNKKGYNIHDSDFSIQK